MAGRYSSSREDLLQKAQDVNDILRQLKSAAQGSQGNRGRGSSRGRGRGQQPHYTHNKCAGSEDSVSPDEPTFSPRGYGYSQQHQGRGQYRPRGKRGYPKPAEGWRHWGGNISPLEEPRPVDPYSMVDILIQCPNFSLSLLQLVEKHNLHPGQVREFVAQYSQVFSLNGEEVELTPQIGLCAAHAGPKGCQQRSSCSKLHMCPSFILDVCQDEDNCVLGHRWHTGHNLRILKQFHMNYARYPTLRAFFSSLLKKEQDSAEPIDICMKYNEGGCDQNCKSLHVCLRFVLQLTRCSSSNCKLNHNLLNHQCSQLLQSHGLPTNESPRDIVMAILQVNPSLSERQNSGRGSAAVNKDKKQVEKKIDESKVTKSAKTKVTKSDQSEVAKSPRKKNFTNVQQTTENMSSGSEQESETESSNDTKDSSDHGSGSDLEEKIKKTRLSKAKNKTNKQEKQDSTTPKVEILRTQWSHYLHGDTKIPQICYYSVESLCRYEASGCLRLHSTQHFHWQLKDNQNRWVNLRPSQVVCLERAYCDPKEEGVDLPRLDPAELERSLSGLLILLGRDVWHADFTTMTMTNKSQNRSIPLRRLCTEPITGQVIKPATFLWYFLDKNKTWIQYGNVDTTGETKLVSSVTSQDIEKNYIQNASTPLPFNSSSFTYILDFTTMKQTNQSTTVSRDVRRRPEPHLPSEKPTEDKANKPGQSFPSDWEAMQPGERMRMVTLASSSPEYKSVEGLLAGRISPSLIVKIERIQNPFLWRAFQNKVTELAAIYGDDGQADIRQLFHGTAHNVVSSICSENFDWRLHGTASGQAYGRGTYFSTDAAYSYGYCRQDASGMKFMFVARVAVGSKTVGSSSMARPPINPATAQPFDSTVDNVAQPKIIVKYDKQEYYPEFIMTLT